MSIFAIGDLHLSLGTNKPMDVFPGWEGYLTKLVSNWRRLIAEADTVVLAGDTSWAMRLCDTVADFTFLQSLPGRKVILKGNHDYWWTTVAKMDRFLQKQGFTTLHFLHNNHYQVEGISLCGTRGWPLDEPNADKAHGEKMIAREAERLRLSLASAHKADPMSQKWAFFHYPPALRDQAEEASPLIDIMREYGVTRCCYGHLHGQRASNAVQGVHDGVEYRLISADALHFCPCKLNGSG